MGRSRRTQKRRLNIQSLESRQLLAADVIDIQNSDLPEDVNVDGNVTALDALMIINRIRESRIALDTDGDGPTENDGQRVTMFRDVNGDGRVTSLDALRVINRMGRGGRPPQDGGSDGPSETPGPQPQAEVRSFDGSGNNVDNPERGTPGSEFRRLVESEYADGASSPAGEDRPSARVISNLVADQDESIPNDRNLSDLIWQWGQFIDHDIDLTGEGHDESFDIVVPTGDASFDPFATGTQTISLTRSGFADGTGVEAPRQQINEITSFIDGSMVYGSSEEVANSLRAFEGGRMLVSENDLLPIGENGFFLAGDVRANEQSGLTAMHTLWVREHNRLADEISANNPDLSDEEVFQRARSIVIAEIQAITYNEYLPTLLGRDAISRYEGYDPSVDSSISNLFATAIFRFGHTQLSSELLRLDDQGEVVEAGNLALRDAFFNPSHILEGGIDSLLKGLSANVSQEIDTQLVDDVRNFLFGPPGAGGFDLASLNIQRGRDHGLPDYNSVREQLGLERNETFADISSDPEVQARLEAAYGDVDQIDVWVGALAEDHLRSASVGELTSAVLIEQFTALRDGDRFWYQNIFSGRRLEQLESTRLSDVIERNTELTSIQGNAFVVPGDRPDRNDRPRRQLAQTDDPAATDLSTDPIVQDSVIAGDTLRPHPPHLVDEGGLAATQSPPPPTEVADRTRPRRDPTLSGLNPEEVDAAFAELG